MDRFRTPYADECRDRDERIRDARAEENFERDREEREPPINMDELLRKRGQYLRFIELANDVIAATERFHTERKPNKHEIDSASWKLYAYADATWRATYKAGYLAAMRELQKQ